MPPFQPSGILSSNLENSTFVHKASGLLFADEIANLDEEKTVNPTTRKIVSPSIHREFTLDSLPPQFRSRAWDLTLRIRVSKFGDPVGNIKVVKSSGDSVLDQLTINRIKESRFEPAHFEGSKEYFDYNFDMKIQYQ
jgi:hypothetical protein